MNPRGCQVGHNNDLFDDEKFALSASQPGMVLLFLVHAVEKIVNRHFTGLN
jgi:hypothetical protein